MCNSTGCCRKGGMCTMGMISKYLLIVGGLDLGILGLGMLFGNDSWNVLNILLGSVPVLEAIVYVLIGVAAVMKIFGGCRCGKCTTGGHDDHSESAHSEAEETTEMKM